MVAKITLILLMMIIHSQQSWPQTLKVKSERQFKIAFASCYKVFNVENNPIFSSIEATNPDVFIWLGDVAYVDKRVVAPFIFAPNDNETNIREIYNFTFNDQKYQKMKKSTQVIGIYDDHDYNLNNGDGRLDLKHKEQIK